MNTSFSFALPKKNSPKPVQSSLQGNTTYQRNARPSPSIVDQPPISELTDSQKQEKAIKLKNEGNFLAESGHFVRALEKWDQAIEMNPENAIFHELKAQVLLEMGEDEMALTAALNAVQLGPTWHDAFVTLSRVYLNTGELEESKKCLEMALKLSKQEESSSPFSSLETSSSPHEIEEEMEYIIELINLKNLRQESQLETKDKDQDQQNSH